MDVSIVIVTYNTLNMTCECIDSIYKHTKDCSFEVILIDNASSDGSKDVFKIDKRVYYIYSDVNLGFGKANNIGIKHASGKYVFFLNSDTLLLNNAVKIFFDYCEQKGSTCGPVGSYLLNEKGDIIHSYGNIYNFYRRLFHQDQIRTRREQNVLVVEYITGADLFIRKDIIDKYGAFDPDFFMYCEEVEMQYRYHKLGGYQSRIIEGPQIMHLVGKSFENSKEIIDVEKSYRKGLIIERSRFLLVKKTSNTFTYCLYRIFAFMQGLLRYRNIPKGHITDYLKFLLTIV